MTLAVFVTLTLDQSNAPLNGLYGHSTDNNKTKVTIKIKLFI